MLQPRHPAVAAGRWRRRRHRLGWGTPARSPGRDLPGKNCLLRSWETPAEITLALRSRVGQLNVESAEELQIVQEIAAQLQIKTPISVRLNPGIEAGAHDKISTGRERDKFGILFAEARETYRQAKTSPHLDLQGIACHIGSQITELEAFEKAFARLGDLVRLLREDGIILRRIDLGGGLGIKYRDEIPARMADYAEVIFRDR